MSREFWTEDREKTLEDGWAAGLFASQIANAIGAGCTRNMVIGKANRLELPPRNARQRSRLWAERYASQASKEGWKRRRANGAY